MCSSQQSEAIGRGVMTIHLTKTLTTKIISLGAE